MSVDRLASLTALAEPLAASLGLELWGVELAGSGHPVVRLFVDAAHNPAQDAEGETPSDAYTTEDEESSGVSIEQCARLSRLLGLTMDVEEPFASAWTLEVSSPGLERTFFRLDQMRGYLGCELDVVLVRPHGAWPQGEAALGRKKFRGELLRVTDTHFTMTVAADSRKPDDPAEVSIEWSEVRKAHVIHPFAEPGLPGKSDKTQPPRTAGKAQTKPAKRGVKGPSDELDD